MAKIIDHQILKNFNDEKYFDKEALISFLTDLNPDITENAITWRIHDLVKRKVIEQVKLGRYTISKKTTFNPCISDNLTQLSKIMTKEFNQLEHCLWNTEWLNDFTRHQLGTSFYLIEVEKDFVEEVFNFYSESKRFRAFIDPNEEMMARYVGNENSIIIKPLISRSPKERKAIKEKSKDKIWIPTLEKILVDVYSDSVTFYAVQGNEMNTIFDHAIQQHQINFTKLISYAKRRNKEKQISNFLKKNFGDTVKDILE